MVTKVRFLCLPDIFWCLLYVFGTKLQEAEILVSITRGIIKPKNILIASKATPGWLLSNLPKLEKLKLFTAHKLGLLFCIQFPTTVTVTVKVAL